MKKIVGVIMLVLGVTATGIGTVSLINIKSKAASSVAIIGGADGPTSIFIAGKVGSPLYAAIAVGVILLIVGLLLLLKKRK